MSVLHSPRSSPRHPSPGSSLLFPLSFPLSSPPNSSSSTTSSDDAPPDPLRPDGPALPTSGNPNDVDNFLVSMLINGSIGFLLILAFLLFRRRLSWIYAPRLNASTRKSDVPPPPIGERLFDCFSVCLTTPESVLLQSAGPDAVIFARFFRLSSILFFVSSLLGAVMLILNTQGGNGKKRFDEMSIANIKDGSPTLFIHLLFAWIINLLALYLMFRAWIGWVSIRHAYLANIHQQDQNLTVLVQNVPKKARSDDGLSAYFSRLYPLNFHSAVIVKDTTTLEKIIERRDYYLAKLEHAYGVWGETGEKPKAREQKSEAEQWVDSFLCSHRCHALTSFLFYACRSEVDAIEYYTYKLSKYNKLVEREQKRVSALLPCTSGFVSFKTALVTNTAVRVEHNPRPFLYTAKQAPLVHDVYWKALQLTRRSKLLRSILVNSLIAFAIFFLTVPVAFIQSLSNLDKLAQYIQPLQPLVANRANLPWLGVVEGYLPSLALMLIMLVLPVILLQLCRLQGIESYSWQQLSLLHKYFLFQIFVFLIVNAFTQIFIHLQSVWSQISFELATQYLAAGFPAVAAFFINFIMLRAMTGFPLQLVRLWPLIWGELSLRYRCKTEREKREVQKPPTIDYGEEYPEHMLIFTVGMVYAIIAPVVLPFVYLYFFLGYITKVYQSLYMYVGTFESGGMYWPSVFQRLTCSLLLGQFTLIGIFLSNNPLCSSLMLPLPIITYICNAYVWSAYWEKGRYLPVEIAEEVDRKRREEEDKAEQEGMRASPKYTYEGPDIDKAVGTAKTPAAEESKEKGDPGDGEEVRVSVARTEQVKRQRTLPEDSDVIQRSDHDIKHKSKHQDRNSRAWGDLNDLSVRAKSSRRATEETQGGAFSFSPSSTEKAADAFSTPPLPSVPTPAELLHPPPSQARLSLHPSKHIHTSSITSAQEADHAYKRALHPYTQPELLAPTLILPDLDSELKTHGNFARMVDAALEEQYAVMPSPFNYDEAERQQMEKESDREVRETRESLRASRARRRGSEDEGEVSTGSSVNLPPGVHTALLSSPWHRQVRYSGEAERRGWPSVSLNVAEEWVDAEDDDV